MARCDAFLASRVTERTHGEQVLDHHVPMTLNTSQAAARSKRLVAVLVAAVIGLTALLAGMPTAAAELPTIDLPQNPKVMVPYGVLEVTATALPYGDADCTGVVDLPGLDTVTVSPGHVMTICVVLVNVGSGVILPPVVEILGVDSGTHVVRPELTTRTLYPGTIEYLSYELVVTPRTDAVLEVRAQSFDVHGHWVFDLDPVGVDLGPPRAPFGLRAPWH